MCAWRPNTVSAYNPGVKKWINYCVKHHVNYYNFGFHDFVNFLVYRRNVHNDSYPSLSRYSNGMSLILKNYVMSPENAAVLQILMRGFFHQKPPLPKPKVIWDVNVVLGFLKKWPPWRKLTLHALSCKVVTLTMLASIKRVAEMHMLDTQHYTANQEGITFQLQQPVKNFRPSTKQHAETLHTVFIPRHFQDLDICPVQGLLHYIFRTKDIRSSTKLFITTKDPFGQCAKYTIRMWIVKTLTNAGIPNATAHQIRSAAASKSLAAGNSLQKICDMAAWTQESTFTKIYMKDIVSRKTWNTCITKNKPLFKAARKKIKIAAKRSAINKSKLAQLRAPQNPIMFTERPSHLQPRKNCPIAPKVTPICVQVQQDKAPTSPQHSLPPPGSPISTSGITDPKSFNFYQPLTIQQVTPVHKVEQVEQLHSAEIQNPTPVGQFVTLAQCNHNNLALPSPDSKSKNHEVITWLQQSAPTHPPQNQPKPPPLIKIMSPPIHTNNNQISSTTKRALKNWLLLKPNIQTNSPQPPMQKVKPNCFLDNTPYGPVATLGVALYRVKPQCEIGRVPMQPGTVTLNDDFCRRGDYCERGTTITRIPLQAIPLQERFTLYRAMLTELDNILDKEKTPITMFTTVQKYVKQLLSLNTLYLSDIHTFLHPTLVITCSGKHHTVVGRFCVDITAKEYLLYKLANLNEPIHLKMDHSFPITGMLMTNDLHNFLLNYHSKANNIRQKFSPQNQSARE